MTLAREKSRCWCEFETRRWGWIDRRQGEDHHEWIQSWVKATTSDKCMFRKQMSFFFFLCCVSNGVGGLIRRMIEVHANVSTYGGKEREYYGHCLESGPKAPETLPKKKKKANNKKTETSESSVSRCGWLVVWLVVWASCIFRPSDPVSVQSSKDRKRGRERREENLFGKIVHQSSGVWMLALRKGAKRKRIKKTLKYWPVCQPTFSISNTGNIRCPIGLLACVASRYYQRMPAPRHLDEKESNIGIKLTKGLIKLGLPFRPANYSLIQVWLSVWTHQKFFHRLIHYISSN